MNIGLAGDQNVPTISYKGVKSAMPSMLKWCWEIEPRPKRKTLHD